MWPAAIRAGGKAAAAGSSSGCLFGSGVVPAAIRSDDRVSLFRPPSAALVGASPVVGLKDWIDHRPGGLYRVFTGEERSIAGHGVAQKPLVGRFLCRPFFEQVELSLVPDELLPCDLDASGQGDGRAGGKPESQVVGPAVSSARSRRKASAAAASTPPGPRSRFRPGICRSAGTRAPPPSATNR